eukprot:358645-Chlamydomonas_euryale.AAC.17
MPSIPIVTYVSTTLDSTTCTTGPLPPPPHAHTTAAHHHHRANTQHPAPTTATRTHMMRT